MKNFSILGSKDNVLWTLKLLSLWFKDRNLKDITDEEMSTALSFIGACGNNIEKQGA